MRFGRKNGQFHFGHSCMTMYPSPRIILPWHLIVPDRSLVRGDFRIIIVDLLSKLIPSIAPDCVFAHMRVLAQNEKRQKLLNTTFVGHVADEAAHIMRDPGFP